MLRYNLELDRLLLTTLVSITCFEYRAFRLLLLFLSTCAAFYFPIGIIYGYPDLNMVASLYETNLNESREFISAIPLLYYLIALNYWLFSYWLTKHRVVFLPKKRLVIVFLPLSGKILLHQPPIPKRL